MKNRLIALSGVDGSGKSTLAQGLVSKLKKEGKSVLTLNVFEYFVLKKIIELFRKPSGKIRGPMKNKNPFLVFSLPFVIIDFWIHYLLQLNPLRRNHDYIICDRYFTDMLVILSYLDYLPKDLFKFCTEIIPKPNLQVILRLDPNQARSKEHTLEYYKDEQALYNEITGKNVIKIDASQSKDKILKQVLKVLNETNS